MSWFTRIFKGERDQPRTATPSEEATATPVGPSAGTSPVAADRPVEPPPAPIPEAAQAAGGEPPAGPARAEEPETAPAPPRRSMREDMRDLRRAGRWSDFDAREWERWTANGAQPLMATWEEAVAAGRNLQSAIREGRAGAYAGARVEALREQCRTYLLPPRGAELVLAWSEDRLRAVWHGRPVADFLLGQTLELVRGTTYGPGAFALAEEVLKTEGVGGRGVDEARQFFAAPRTVHLFDPEQGCIRGPNGVVAVVSGSVPGEVGRQMAAGPWAVKALLGTMSGLETCVEGARKRARRGGELLARVPELEALALRLRHLKAWMQCGLPGPERPGREAAWREAPPDRVPRVRGLHEEQERPRGRGQGRGMSR